MTVICALRENGKTWIGSDAQTNKNVLKMTLDKGKWVNVKPWTIGVSGSYRALTVLSNRLNVKDNGHRYAFDLVEDIRNLMADDGFSDGKDNYGPLSFGQEMILASKNELWAVCAAFSITPIPEGVLYSIGSGSEFAMGSGYTSDNDETIHPTYTTKGRVEEALHAAIRFDANCGTPIFVEEVK